MGDDLSALEMQDCITLQKAFERGAAYATTEESVFAMMTPILAGIRSQSGGLITQLENGDKLSTPEGVQDKFSQVPSSGTASFAIGSEDLSANFNNIEKGTEDDSGFLTKLKGNWTGGGKGLNKIFDSKCIPCGVRLDTLGQVLVEGFEDFGKAFLEHWKNWLSMFLKQLMAFKDLFSMPDNLIDICALIKFFLDFMCVPDLQRMLAALMALMARVNFDFSLTINLVLGLIAPLLIPFLSNLVDMMAKYIMMIIKPIECIIRSIQNLISKLDYNILFQNVEKLDKNISIGRKQGQVTGKGGVNITAGIQGIRTGVGDADIPIISYPATLIPPDASIELTDLHSGNKRAFETSFNPLNAFYIPFVGKAADAIKRDNARRQADVETAYKELQAVQTRGPTGNTIGERERYLDQVDKAKENYKDTKEQRDLSALGRLNSKLDESLSGFKSVIFLIIEKLKKAAAAVEAFFNSLYDELKKLMGEWIGGSGSYIEAMFEKMELIQLISLISSIIKFLLKGLKCDDDEDDQIKVERFINTRQDMSIWTDNEGNLHIEENDKEILQAIEQAVSVLGSNTDTDLSPRQKLDSLIEFTSDPVLNTEIARATEAIITPVKVVFKCPLQTSVSDAEQVNKWISEIE